MSRVGFINITPARVFQSNGYDLFYTAGNVGIGTSAPSNLLDVSGNVTINGNVNIDSGALFVNAANNRVGVNTTTPSTALDVSGATTISGNLTVDTNTLVVDASNNRVGIGMNNPSVALDVSGVIRQSSFIAFLATCAGSATISASNLIGSTLFNNIIYNKGNAWSSGYFRPNIPGYYFISVTIPGRYTDTTFTIRKNTDINYASHSTATGTALTQVRGSGNTLYTTITGCAVVYLNGLLENVSVWNGSKSIGDGYSNEGNICGYLLFSTTE